MTILYIHGFCSTGEGSSKVKIIEKVFPDAKIIAPNLSYEIPKATAELNAVFASEDYNIDLIIGTSLGGLFADFFGKFFNVDSVVINPLVDWATFCNENCGKEHTNHKTRETFFFEDKNDIMLELFANFTNESENRDNLTHVVLGEKDTVLDNSLAIEKYQGQKNTTIKWYPDDHRLLKSFETALKERFQQGS